jgi:hypothetical protein
MAYDSHRGVTVFFGGEYSDGGDAEVFYYNDTWEYDGISWKKISINGPAPYGGSGHALAYDAERRVVVLVGAGNLDLAGENWLYWGDGTNGAWSQSLEMPDPVHGHIMVYDSARRAVVLHGGVHKDDKCYYPSPRTWEWNGRSWGLTSESLELATHAAAFDADRGLTVIFGGYYLSRHPILCDVVVPVLMRDHTWGYNGQGWAPIDDGSTPALRTAHAMAYDLRRKKTVMFGGRDYAGDATVIGDDTDELTAGVGWTSVATSGPPPRALHAMVYDSRRDVMVLFGGGLQVSTPTGPVEFAPLDDTWELIDECAHPQDRWVDFTYVGTEDGTFEAPFNTLAEGVDSVFPRGTIRIKAGARDERLTVSKAMTLVAVGGAVTIGH